MRKGLCYLTLGLAVLGCAQDAPAPPSSPSLLGEWTLGDRVYTYYDAHNRVTQSGTTPADANRPLRFVIGATTWHEDYSQPSDYLYTRNDSVVVTHLLDGNALVPVATYTVVDLRDHALVLRYDLPQFGGGRFTRQYFFRR